MSTAMAGASTAATLIVDEAAGASWSGVPNAAGVLGTALGTLTAGHLISRHGGKKVLLGLYGAAVAGALTAFAAAANTTMVVLVLGMFLGNINNWPTGSRRHLCVAGTVGARCAWR